MRAQGVNIGPVIYGLNTVKIYFNRDNKCISECGIEFPV